jgi:hypothetical protein
LQELDDESQAGPAYDMGSKAVVAPAAFWPETSDSEGE